MVFKSMKNYIIQNAKMKSSNYVDAFKTFSKFVKVNVYIQL